jgi:hypothetical protein
MMNGSTQGAKWCLTREKEKVSMHSRYNCSASYSTNTVSFNRLQCVVKATVYFGLLIQQFNFVHIRSS